MRISDWSSDVCSSDLSYSARANAKRFQDFIADPNFLLRFGGKGDADGVADPGPEQIADADRTLHRAADQAPGLCDPQMQRALHGFCKTHIGRYRQQDVARDRKSTRLHSSH